METSKTYPYIQKPRYRLAKHNLCLNTNKLLCFSKGKCLLYMIGKCSESPKTKIKRKTSGTENNIKEMLVSRRSNLIAKSRLLIQYEIRNMTEPTKNNMSSTPELLLYKATKPAPCHLGETRKRAMPCAIMHKFNLKKSNTDFICNHKQVAQRVAVGKCIFKLQSIDIIVRHF